MNSIACCIAFGFAVLFASPCLPLLCFALLCRALDSVLPCLTLLCFPLLCLCLCLCLCMCLCLCLCLCQCTHSSQLTIQWSPVDKPQLTFWMVVWVAVAPTTSVHIQLSTGNKKSSEALRRLRRGWVGSKPEPHITTQR